MSPFFRIRVNAWTKQNLIMQSPVFLELLLTTLLKVSCTYFERLAAAILEKRGTGVASLSNEKVA